MKADITEDYKGALIQHGPYNDRIYIMKCPQKMDPDLPIHLLQLAQSKRYTKIFGKIPESHKPAFEHAGYITEAKVPDFFLNNETAFFMSLFFSDQRQVNPHQEKITEIINLAQTKQTSEPHEIHEKYQVSKCTENCAQNMSELYSLIFPSYPFPIHDPNYLIETMRSHVDYYSISLNNKLIALSSAEKDMANKNSEMTDFATLPEFRGKGLAQQLLLKMENKIAEQGIRSFYTICRAVSPGMNITFAKSGYQYRGTLVNNTNISGQIESMNIWSKVH